MKPLDKNLIPKSIFDHDFTKGNIGWCKDDNIKHLFEMDEGTVLVSNKGTLRYIAIARRTRLDLILVDSPKDEFIKLLHTYTPKLKTVISKSATIGKNTVIHKGTIIEDGVIIGDNCTIGGDGFGFNNGEFIPHKGRVLIREGARIGNNVCIDKAVVGNTEIGKDVKIDNLVHIAHGVRIGEGSMIIAGAVVCGSVVIGKNVWVSPNTSIRQHLKIGDNAVIGLGAVVVKNVKEGKTVYGNPAK